jgi:hypothetical protein
MVPKYTSRVWMGRVGREEENYGIGVPTEFISKFRSA